MMERIPACVWWPHLCAAVGLGSFTANTRACLCVPPAGEFCVLVGYASGCMLLVFGSVPVMCVSRLVCMCHATGWSVYI